MVKLVGVGVVGPIFIDFQSCHGRFFAVAYVLYFSKSSLDPCLAGLAFRGSPDFGIVNHNTQSYEIKSPPWTILWFRILGIFSVENIKR